MTSTDHTLVFAAQRAAMVEGQLRPNRITDGAVLAACADVAREDCAGAVAANHAYVDQPLVLGAGRMGFTPLVSAHLVQAITERLGGVGGKTILVVGAGMGYEALLLAHMGARVVALEEDAALVDRATRNAVASHGERMTVVHGPLAAGYAAEAPYDALLVGVPFAVLPPSLVAQLQDDGVLAGVKVRTNGIADVCVAAKRGNALADDVVMETEGQVFPAFAAEQRFVF